ncbi:CatB-related O-acetyltransferase [candidate division KSB1 bacterium]|nr:CatB-related O-acetyltransferase [candidate division KSB1 bacterium]
MDPTSVYPREGDETVCYLKNVVFNANIRVGDYTIYHDYRHGMNFERKNVVFHHDQQNTRLIIGKFCCIEAGVKFILNRRNQLTDSISSYPFSFWGHRTENELRVSDTQEKRYDIVIGNDVLIGYEAIIMAGVHIGDGAVVRPRSVVTHHVDAYTIVAGIPAQAVQNRFDRTVTGMLLRLKWWDWDIVKIRQYMSLLCSNSTEELKKFFSSLDIP